MKEFIRILKVIARLFTNKECSIIKIFRNIYLNLFRVEYKHNSTIVCAKHTDIK